MAMKNFFKKAASWRKKKGAWAVLGLIALSSAGFQRYQKSKAPPLPDMTLATASPGDLEVRFKEIGEIAAKNSVNVASKVSGRVILLGIQEGAVVKAGQKLAVIQPGRTETERYLPSTVKSPISGVVMRYLKDQNNNQNENRFPEVGDYVTGLFESQTPTYLMTIADMSQVIVKLKISEMDILKLQEGMPVTVTVDALKDAKFSAKVSMIAPQAEKDSTGGKVFRVEVALDVIDKRLRTGMTARVDALLTKKPGVLKMPLGALFEEMGQQFVYLDAKPKAKQVKVAAGLRTELEVEVLEGLKAGDKIYTEKPAEFEPLAGTPNGGSKPAI